MDRSPSDEEAIVLNFIRDEPAAEDEFGSHGRLAKAIGTVIQTQKELKVVGLLGAWGSGKSTVIKLVQTYLTKHEGSTRTYCFSYDAWLHQSDPPRRSFLETLIKFLIDNKLTQETDKWHDRLDHLNRQVEDTEAISTPTLTTTGRVALFSLLLLPLGMQLVGHDWVRDAFGPNPSSPYVYWAVRAGIVILLLPVLFALGLYFSWRPSRWPFAWHWPPLSKKFWSATNWISHRHPHEDDSIVSLIMNKQIQRVRNRVTRSPDPTAIEFQNIFREIMEDVSASDRRFLFVIDNLDRLPETEAVAMWGTIRSFFLGAIETNHVRRLSNQLPTVILPIDPHAVERMYMATHGEHAPALAQSFTDKTFDLTFRVTRPLLSDWKQYLAKKMAAVFGKHIDERSIYLTGLLLENWLPTDPNASITPRGINTLINLMGTLWLQWRKEDIAFISIAYYAIFLNGSDINIHHAVGMPIGGIESYDPNWQRSIAAIYYGVPPKDAAQILIEQPLRNAITERNFDEYKRLADIRGFEQVLQRLLDQATSGAGSDPSFVLSAAGLLDQLQLENRTWLTIAWDSLRRGFEKPTTWQALSAEEAPSFAALLARCNAEETAKVLLALSAKLADINEGIAQRPGFAEHFAAICAVAASAASSKQIDLPAITVPGGAALYLSVLSACARNANLLSELNAKATPDDIVAELANGLADKAASASVEAKLRALIARAETMPWAKLIEAAGLVVQDQNATAFAINPALSCLGLLRKSDKAARARLKQLFDGQQLVARLNEAHSQKLLEVEARLTALLMLSGSIAPAPNGQAWEVVLKEQPDLIDYIDRALIEFDTENNLKMLVKLGSANEGALPLIYGLVSLHVREYRLGKLVIGEVIKELPRYLKFVESDLQGAFIEDVSQYETFWDEIRPLAFDGNVTRIFSTLIASHEDTHVKAQAELLEKLKELTVEQWTAALISGDEPLSLAMALSEATEKRTHIGSALFDALKDTIPQLLSDSDRAYRKSWFSSLELVNSSSRQTLIRYLRDQIIHGTTVADILALVVGGGDTLFAEFAQDADGATLYVILPLLSSEDGIAWITANVSKLAGWVSVSDEATRDVLVQKLSDLWSAANEDEKKRYQDIELAWNLPEFPIEPETGTVSESEAQAE
jgi:hypothetical protein